MSHSHGVYDVDAHFTIDVNTRKIVNLSAKSNLIQNDHNSERFTFEIPRCVDGHDMTLCDKVEIHYINVSSNGVDKSSGVYLVDDMAHSASLNDNAVFSWLVSANATQHSGCLNFLIRFVCLDDDVIDYAWHTDIYKGIKVKDGMNNGEAVAAQFPDVLEAWKREVMAEILGTIPNGDEVAY